MHGIGVNLLVSSARISVKASASVPSLGLRTLTGVYKKTICIEYYYVLALLDCILYVFKEFFEFFRHFILRVLSWGFLCWISLPKRIVIICPSQIFVYYRCFCMSRESAAVVEGVVVFTSSSFVSSVEPSLFGCSLYTESPGFFCIRSAPLKGSDVSERTPGLKRISLKRLMCARADRSL